MCYYIIVENRCCTIHERMRSCLLSSLICSWLHAWATCIRIHWWVLNQVLSWCMQYVVNCITCYDIDHIIMKEMLYLWTVLASTMILSSNLSWLVLPITQLQNPVIEELMHKKYTSDALQNYTYKGTSWSKPKMHAKIHFTAWPCISVNPWATHPPSGLGYTRICFEDVLLYAKSFHCPTSMSP